MDMFGFSAAQLQSAGAQWTAREIAQQPQIWAELESLVVGNAGLARFLDPLLQRSDLRIILTGAGTSAHIGECLAPALARIPGRRVEAISTTDIVSSPESFLSVKAPTLLVSFGRSGNSPESVAAVELADTCIEQCFHLILTCDAQGALYKRAQGSARAYAVLLPEKSNDRSFAMTSSFSGMLLAAALALRVFPAAGTAQLARAAERVIPDVLPLLQQLVGRNFKRAVYLGSREFKGLARESALKMLELTDGQVVAVAETPLGFRHGPKTILSSETLVLVYVSNDDYTRQYDLDLIGELRRDGVAGRVVALSGRAGMPAHPDNIVIPSSGDPVAGSSDLGLCFGYAMFAQSLALLRSLSLGVRPDNPNAAGTVSRVVKGVTIHPWRSH
jgi:tagatose-6-phosphate ketose/aldose isomerase